MTVESPYENRLLEAIGRASGPSDRAVLLAELAGYAARVGRFDEAEAILRDVRREFGDGQSGRVTVMLMWAEGLLAYFRDLDPRAHDRLTRAQFLSTAARSASLSALTSAWLAHIDFNLHRHDQMGRAIRICVDTLSASDLQAQCRLALTLGDAFTVVDDADAARGWYAEAHGLAVDLGDHAAVGALTYNQAALAAFAGRLASVYLPIDGARLDRVAAVVRSAANYQGLAQLRSLQHLLDDAQAAVLILQGKFNDAAQLVERVIRAGAPVSPSGHKVTALCDVALCYAKLGLNEQLGEVLQQIRTEELDRRTADDRAIAYAALRSAFVIMGRDSDAATCEQHMRRSIDEHSLRTSSLRATLGPFRSVDVLGNSRRGVRA